MAARIRRQITCRLLFYLFISGEIYYLYVMAYCALAITLPAVTALFSA